MPTHYDEMDDISHRKPTKTQAARLLILVTESLHICFDNFLLFIYENLY